MKWQWLKINKNSAACWTSSSDSLYHWFLEMFKVSDRQKHIYMYINNYYGFTAKCKQWGALDALCWVFMASESNISHLISLYCEWPSLGQRIIVWFYENKCEDDHLARLSGSGRSSNSVSPLGPRGYKY